MVPDSSSISREQLCRRGIGQRTCFAGRAHSYRFWTAHLLYKKLCRRSTRQLIYFAGTALSPRYRTARLIRGNKSVAEAPDSSSISREMLCCRGTGQLTYFDGRLCRRGTEQLIFYGNSSVAEALDSSFFTGTALSRNQCLAGTALLQRHRIAHLFRGNTFFLYRNSSVAEALDS